MNVLGMGPMELMLIVVLALIVFGPAKLPEIMGQIGRAIGDFRRATSELSDEFNRTIQTELQETRAIVEETRGIMQETTAAVREAHTAVGEAGAVVKTLPTTPLPAPTRVAEPPVVNGTSTPAESAEPAPPLADTSQWSWETAVPPASDREPEPVPPASDSEHEPEPVVSDAEVEPIEPQPEPVAKTERARDDLQPPY